MVFLLLLSEKAKEVRQALLLYNYLKLTYNSTAEMSHLSSLVPLKPRRLPNPGSGMCTSLSLDFALFSLFYPRDGLLSGIHHLIICRNDTVTASIIEISAYAYHDHWFYKFCLTLAPTVSPEIC